MKNAEQTTEVIEFGYMTQTRTQMPVNKKGRELGYSEQVKEVQTWGPENGHMSGLVTTRHMWVGCFGSQVFRTTQKWA